MNKRIRKKRIKRAVRELVAAYQEYETARERVFLWNVQNRDPVLPGNRVDDGAQWSAAQVSDRRERTKQSGNTALNCGGFSFLKGADAETKPSYLAKRMVQFSDGFGFIQSKDARSHDFYVTMQITQDGRCCRGSYSKRS